MSMIREELCQFKYDLLSSSAIECSARLHLGIHEPWKDMGIL
jgi:hypothetical protein